VTEQSPTPEHLQGRIEKLRASQDRTEKQGLARAMAFFMSMGATMVGAIYGGYLLGTYLQKQTGSEMWLPVMLLGSVAAGASIVYQMLKPFLK